MASNINPKIPPKEYELCMQMLGMFTLEGEKVSDIATPGQVAIFHAIVFRPHWLQQILCSTQYGKSLFVALALIIVSCVQNELVAVVAPSDDKAKIIMRYYIEHLGDNAMFFSQLEKNTRLERLRMEDSKERIVLRKGGGVYILSANAKNAKKGIEAAIGAGARIVIADESSLLPDDIEATIFRMIAGKKNPFYCKIGNPFYRNHFLRSWLNPNYRKIFIDYEQALEEGRYNEDFIAEAEKKPHFDVLFECKFPPEGALDKKGFRRLLTDEQIGNALQEVPSFGELRIGADVAEGGADSNSLILRSANYATAAMEDAIEWQSDDTMDTATKTTNAATEHDVLDQNIFIDNIGVGKGAYDSMIQQKMKVTGVRFSNSADDEIEFANLRAECYWRLRQWVIAGGKLDPRWADQWWQLQHIKYKANAKQQCLIKSKEDMEAESIPSPNTADALAMTFARKSVLKPNAKAEREITKNFDANRRKKGYFTGSRYGYGNSRGRS